jgi:fructan beta-fructosidase
MNDPNGLVYFDGEYHLFYQYYPNALVWGPMHWGHAVSRNLMHWEHLDTALFPDQDGMCFSGSAIVDSQDASGLFNGKPGLLAFYTVHRVLDEASNDYVQQQCIAYSTDKGRSWHKYAANPVIATPGFRDFRDPKVIWHGPSQHWIMALACGQSIRFYRSVNLLDWSLCSEFGAGQGAHTEGPWECPDLFELPLDGGEGSRWVLVVGVGAGEDDWGSFTQYFVGDFDGLEFHNKNAPDQVLLMDHSRDFYAVQSWSDVADGRRLAIAWLSNWLYANQVPSGGWRGSMTLPRELRLEDDGQGARLKQAFVPELDGVLSARAQVMAGRMLGAGEHIRVEGEAGPAFGRMSLVLQDQAQVELCLQQDTYPDLVLSYADGQLAVVHRREGQNGEASFDRFFPHDFSLAVGEGMHLSLEWLCDHGSLEILLQQGSISLTSLSLGSEGGCAPVVAVTQGQCLLESLEHARLSMGHMTADDTTASKLSSGDLDGLQALA